MEIKVHGWRYEGIRGGLSQISIDLGRDPSRWALIQMPNGTGKTTTMALLRAAFSCESFTPEQVKAFKRDDATKDGLFELTLSVDGKLYRLQLRFDFEVGTCSYWTARTDLSGGGLEEGWLLPNDLKRLFAPDFVRLFVFDGELAKEIRTVGRDRAASAIKTLYRINLLAELEQRITTLVEKEQERASSVSTATGKSGVNRWRNAVAQCKERATQLTADIARLRHEYSGAVTRQTELNAKVTNRITADASLRQRADALKMERQTLEKQVLDNTVQALSMYRNPPKLAGRVLERLHALGAKLNQLKLPKTISSEFFKELALQESCICGRPISEVESKTIVERADLYLADDQIAVINKMKLALRECKADDDTFEEAVEILKTALRQNLENSKALDQVQLDLVEAGDTEVEAWRAELQQISSKLSVIEEKLERASTKEPTRQKALGCTDQNNLPLCEAELKRCEEKLSTATNTRNFTYQAGETRRLLAQLISRALDGLREHVRSATNEKLSVLAPSEALQVARIGGSLELEASGLAQKGGVSEGQSLAVAYAFLTSLLADAPYQLPFIVDSPAVSLDTQVRREVGELIPDLFGQMIMFVISSEREGFADAFYSREGVRFLTIWRNGAIVETRDGLDAFRNFHSLEGTI
ncbi:hypothetical protein [Delftia acidovorans]|uniref:hypothetical protein n=1 Tax=Delftia acidovorans TaxID=80866 RepID=UPI000BD3CBB6|nr:hypothetical protein [Delftia acidovorans]SOE35325.1 hypothetical protein SAMN05216519_1306 [Delftia acidovorans]